MKASRAISALVKGVGTVTIIAATCAAGMLAYASIKVPRTGRGLHA